MGIGDSQGCGIIAIVESVQPRACGEKVLLNRTRARVYDPVNPCFYLMSKYDMPARHYAKANSIGRAGMNA